MSEQATMSLDSPLRSGLGSTQQSTLPTFTGTLGPGYAEPTESYEDCMKRMRLVELPHLLGRDPLDDPNYVEQVTDLPDAVEEAAEEEQVVRTWPTPMEGAFERMLSPGPPRQGRTPKDGHALKWFVDPPFDPVRPPVFGIARDFPVPGLLRQLSTLRGTGVRTAPAQPGVGLGGTLRSSASAPASAMWEEEGLRPLHMQRAQPQLGLVSSVIEVGGPDTATPPTDGTDPAAGREIPELCRAAMSHGDVDMQWGARRASPLPEVVPAGRAQPALRIELDERRGPLDVLDERPASPVISSPSRLGTPVSSPASRRYISRALPGEGLGGGGVDFTVKRFRRAVAKGDKAKLESHRKALRRARDSQIEQMQFWMFLPAEPRIDELMAEYCRDPPPVKKWKPTGMQKSATSDKLVALQERPGQPRMAAEKPAPRARSSPTRRK